ncbi:Riboflavin synthase [Geodia barretti]|uniref:Riboflavin synthase n=1 Tax=Geodia barretti TaxID=519541 RepID=A0AA35RRB8_GEOBA|nr:Riboflavin synthase [Geodia barretti]
MFTGIVEEVGTVSVCQEYGLAVKAKKVTEDLRLGDSIAVNGTCLTVVEFDESHFRVDLAPETLRRTSLRELEVGRRVNLERPLAVSDRLGGHIVQGHVDAAGRVMSIRPEGDCFIFRIRTPKRLMPYVVEKGFIALDGISLTVVKKGAASFTVSVIPYSLSNTNLEEKSAGHRVNLEVDILAKYVESLLAR